MHAVAGGRPDRLILNLPNAGRLADLPVDVVIGAPCLVDGAGVHPLPIGPAARLRPRPGEHGKPVELWTIEAATTGTARAARLALTHHPLVDSAAVAGFLVAT